MSKRPCATDKILGLDRRSTLSRAIRHARAAYCDMLPQPLSPADAALAERLAILGGQLLQLDAKALRDDGLSKIESDRHRTLQGQHSRLLKQLNAQRSRRPVGPSLADLFPGKDVAA
jgi:hypothetical protein